MIPDSPIPFFEYFDAISLGVLVLAVGFLLISHRRKSGSLLGSISQTIAASPSSQRIFSIVMTVFFPLYYTFIWLWVAPLTRMPAGFYWLLAAAAICEMIFVWVPAENTKHGLIHAVTAYFVGLAMVVMAALVLLSSAASQPGCYSLLGFFVVSALIGLLMIRSRYRKYFFWYELAFCLSFLLAFSVVAHT